MIWHGHERTTGPRLENDDDDDDDRGDRNNREVNSDGVVGSTQ